MSTRNIDGLTAGVYFDNVSGLPVYVFRESDVREHGRCGLLDKICECTARTNGVRFTVIKRLKHTVFKTQPSLLS